MPAVLLPNAASPDMEYAGHSCVLHAVPCRVVSCWALLCIPQASSAATPDDPRVDLSQLDVAAVLFDSAEPSSFRQAQQVCVCVMFCAGCLVSVHAAVV